MISFLKKLLSLFSKPKALIALEFDQARIAKSLDKCRLSLYDKRDSEVLPIVLKLLESLRSSVAIRMASQRGTNSIEYIRQLQGQIDALAQAFVFISDSTDPNIMREVLKEAQVEERKNVTRFKRPRAESI